MKRVACALTIGLLAGAANAQCPTTFADAARGVYVDFDGYVVRYSRYPDGTVEELEFDSADAPGYRYLSHLGVFILESWELTFGVAQPDTYEVITYDVPLPAQIAANMTYASMTQVRYGTDAPFPEPIEISVGAQGTQTIGNCAMQTLPVEMRAGPPNDLYISNFTYFPALGFAVFVGGGPAGQAPDFFPPTFIGTAPPLAPGAAPAPAAPASPAPASK